MAAGGSAALPAMLVAAPPGSRQQAVPGPAIELAPNGRGAGSGSPACILPRSTTATPWQAAWHWVALLRRCVCRATRHLRPCVDARRQTRIIVHSQRPHHPRRAFSTSAATRQNPRRTGTLSRKFQARRPIPTAPPPPPHLQAAAVELLAPDLWQGHWLRLAWLANGRHAQSAMANARARVVQPASLVPSISPRFHWLR